MVVEALVNVNAQINICPVKLCSLEQGIDLGFVIRAFSFDTFVC